jgi:hypothetical protein
VNLLAPGWVATDANYSACQQEIEIAGLQMTVEEYRAKIAAGVPQKRFLQPSEVARHERSETCHRTSRQLRVPVEIVVQAEVQLRAPGTFNTHLTTLYQGGELRPFAAGRSYDLGYLDESPDNILNLYRLDPLNAVLAQQHLEPIQVIP